MIKTIILSLIISFNSYSSQENEIQHIVSINNHEFEINPTLIKYFIKENNINRIIYDEYTNIYILNYENPQLIIHLQKINETEYFLKKMGGDDSE